MRIGMQDRYEICKTTGADARGWYVRRLHSPSGIPLDESLCPQFYTRAQAREWVSWQRKEKP